MIATSSAYVRGMRHGMRLCGRSLWRRVFLALLVWCLCIGSGLGFLWAAGEHYFQIVTGDSVKVAVVKKWQGYFRVYPHRPGE